MSIHSFLYNWSINHILEHEFFYFGHLGTFMNKQDRRYSDPKARNG